MTLLPCPDCKKIMRAPWKPTRQQIAAAAGKHVPDLLAPGLDVVFCGINPGLYSGAVGHHFARPGNRFWLGPAAELSVAFDLPWPWGGEHFELRDMRPLNYIIGPLGSGKTRLAQRLAVTLPDAAFLGLGAYRLAFGQRLATLGKQPERLAGSEIWILPNPSGLNAHYQLVDLARLFRELRLAVQRKP